jgi:alkylhydroperoxidase/carboxymuconolactone decarboxylase family protein YurZ
MSTTQGETPVMDVIAEMTAASIERSTLDAKTLMLIRLAALVAVDAPPISYMTNLSVGSEVGVELEDVQQVLIGIAPVVGAPRVASAAGKIMRGVGLAVAIAEEEIDEEGAG